MEDIVDNDAVWKNSFINNEAIEEKILKDYSSYAMDMS